MQDFSVAQLILPEGMLDYFLLSDIEQTDEHIYISLTEKNTKPEQYGSEHLESKGFFDPIKVQDFPLRTKTVYLLIKRRKWLNHSTGNIVYRDWELVAKGTRITKEFGAFLKALARYSASQRQ